MSRKIVDTLILDIDNTLFDWFAVWHASFAPLREAIIAQTGRTLDEVDASIRRVHQARRTSEYTFLLEELDVLEELRKTGDIREFFKEAIAASRRNRDQSLALYPSVFRSLWDIKQRGTRIVAYTESMAFYSAYRLKRFGLDGVIDVLFSPADHDHPAGVSLDKLRRLPDDFYELQVTQIRHTPPGELKPNPRVLGDIIKEVGASLDRVAYVGDSLFKDVAMARDIGVMDIHAKYGESQRKPEYSLLQNVSHWTEEDVERERKIIAKSHTFEPSATLKESFAEIYIYCDFQAPIEPCDADLKADRIRNGIEIWKKSVDVQQHFNDLEMRIRNFGLTVLGVLIAAVGFSYQHKLETTVNGYTFPAGLAFIGAAAIAWFMFFIMDRYWYHILLKGAVTHASKIETELKNEVPDISLGQTISQVSGGVRILGVKMNSTRRLSTFYILGFVMLGILFAALFFSKPIAGHPERTEKVQEVVPRGLTEGGEFMAAPVSSPK